MTPWILFAVSLLVRLWLIHAWPIVFGGDTILRLANRDRVLLAYQLPLLQAVIYGISQLTNSLVALRWVMACFGALAAVGFYRLALHFLEPRRAFLAALLAGSNPFLLELSIVPYQEIPMLAALLFAFDYLFRGRPAAASICLGLACLTRYEAWIACPIFLLAWAWPRRREPQQWLRACFLFGWAPLGWMVVHRGLSGEGTFVAEFPGSIERLVRWAYLGWITLKNTPAPVLLLAAIGLWRIRNLRLRLDPRILALSSYLALFLLAILFSAHGVSPNTERFVTSREAVLPIAAVVFLAGFALAGRPKFTLPLALAGIVWGVYDAHRFLKRDTSDPHIQLSYRLAQYLDETLKDGERAVLLTRPAPAELVEAYLNKVAQHGGEQALENARRVLASMDTSSPDFQRTVVHSRLEKGRLTQSFSGDSRIQWAALWSDFTPPTPADTELVTRLRWENQVKVFEEGDVAITVYRLQR